MTTQRPPRHPLRLPFAPLVVGRRSDTGDTVEVEADELVRHLAVFGTTGSGKTSLFLALMLELPPWDPIVSVKPLRAWLSVREP